ncbi:MAG: DUF4261 domain-containing protein [Planctomycetota bacterium]|nr:DUF4261 domain-containing protein [Planctomycetota bacterium]
MGWLGKLFGRGDGPPAIAAPSRNKLAFVLLAEPRLPELAPLIAAFELYSEPGEHLEAGAEEAPKKPELETLTLRLSSGETVIVGLMPVAVPGDEVEAGFARGVGSFRPGFTAPSHVAHLVVFFSGADDVDDLTSFSRFTALLAALAKSAPSVGVYLGSAAVAHDTEFFLKLAFARDTVARMTLWNGVSLAKRPYGALSLLSTGMPQIGLPDLLLETRSSTPTEALTSFFDLLTYVAELGRPLAAHETVGRTAEEKLHVKYVRSPIDPKARVWHVELP